MGFPARSEDEKYTYQDYCGWKDDRRWEIINGRIYDMSPAPSINHQRILGSLFNKFYNYLENKTCEVFVAPFDVILPSGSESMEESTNVVQPDITVVCDKSSLINNKACKGSPALIVEVSSPSTAKRDLKDKLYLYETAGVKEYWVVDSTNKTVMIFKLGADSKYGRPETYGKDDVVRVGVFGELEIDLSRIAWE